MEEEQVLQILGSVGAVITGSHIVYASGKHDVGDVPILYSLVNIVMDAWDEAECQLCKENKPINIDVGHGEAFLARKRAMAG